MILPAGTIVRDDKGEPSYRLLSEIDTDRIHVLKSEQWIDLRTGNHPERHTQPRREMDEFRRTIGRTGKIPA